jgi:hypothetical protein
MTAYTKIDPHDSTFEPQQSSRNCAALDELVISAGEGQVRKSLMHLDPSKRQWRRLLLLATFFFFVDGIYVLTRGVYYRHVSARETGQAGASAASPFSERCRRIRYKNADGNELFQSMPIMYDVVLFAPNVTTTFGVFMIILGFAAFVAAWRYANVRELGQLPLVNRTCASDHIPTCLADTACAHLSCY